MSSTLAHLASTAAAVLVLAGARGAGAAEQAAATCEGRLSGDAKATFACSVVLGMQPGGEHAFVIETAGPVEGVPSLVPGAFQLPSPPRPGTYTLAELGMGKAAVAIQGGALYTATKTSSQRGEVTLRLASVKKRPSAPGGYAVRGTYRARLVPVGGGKTGEIVVDVKF